MRDFAIETPEVDIEFGDFPFKGRVIPDANQVAHLLEFDAENISPEVNLRADVDKN